MNQSKIPAFTAVKTMIEKHHGDIINYFKEGQTNAKAQNMNAKIQRFLAVILASKTETSSFTAYRGASLSPSKKELAAISYFILSLFKNYILKPVISSRRIYTARKNRLSPDLLFFSLFFSFGGWWAWRAFSLFAFFFPG